MSWRWGWKPYVPVAQRRAKAARAMDRLRKKGGDVQPVVIEGREIARTFWGRAWCDHLEKFSDYANRLPRGRTYVRNGSVCHLAIKPGKVAAKVSGSELYDVTIDIKALAAPRWKCVRDACAGQVASLLELLQGRLSDHVMNVVTDLDKGLFPRPNEISMACSCPDWAGVCKHVAAVMYGIGARLDEKPELLFLLRGVDHNDLISKATATTMLARTPKAGQKTLGEERISDVFGIDLAPQNEAPPRNSAAKPRQADDSAAAIGTSSPKPRRRAVAAAVVRGVAQGASRRRGRKSA